MFNPILHSIILILAPEHFPVIALFQHNLAEEEPERAALMAERLMELGATVVKSKSIFYIFMYYLTMISLTYYSIPLNTL